MSENKRPHIIILNPDEMRWDAMRHMGNRAAYTPNLDHLAVHEAVSFDQAYCQNPVCVPSRCSFLTGLYPHTTGHRTMNYLMHEGEESLFSELKQAGYHVWLNGRNDFLAGQINDLEAYHADEVFYYDKTEKPDAGALQKMSGMMGKKPVGNGAVAEKVYNHFTGIAAGGSAEGDWRDTYAAIDRIRRVDELEGKPLCLFLGWTNPHPPYMVEQKYYDWIDRDKIVEPISLAETKGKSRMVEKLHEFANVDGMSEEAWLELRHVYLAQCAMVDDMVGRVITALKEAGIYDDSVIFFFSDHGDYAGDYHLPEKAQSSFEDVITRVPFLIKPPKGEDVDAGLCSSMVELVDFYATAMGYAGVSQTHDHFGKDLRGVISDRSQKVRTYVHCEGGRNANEWQCDEWHNSGETGPKKTDDYYAKKQAQLDDDAHEKATMIRDGEWKYIYRSSGACELYHMTEDPYELTNLYITVDPTSVQGQEIRKIEVLMQEKLLSWYQTTCDIVPKKMDTRFTEEKIWSTLRNMVPAQMEGQIRAYLREKHPDYMEAIFYTMGLLQQMKKDS